MRANLVVVVEASVTSTLVLNLAQDASSAILTEVLSKKTLGHLWCVEGLELEGVRLWGLHC